MLADSQNTVERMMRNGQAFGTVEDYIDTTPFPDRQKAALWLLAWSYHDRQIQRRVVKEALSHAALATGCTTPGHGPCTGHYYEDDTTMAYISIKTDDGGGLRTLHERVTPADFDNEVFCAHLVARLRWAVEDTCTPRNASDELQLAKESQT